MKQTSTNINCLYVFVFQYLIGQSTYSYYLMLQIYLPNHTQLLILLPIPFKGFQNNNTEEMSRVPCRIYRLMRTLFPYKQFSVYVPLVCEVQTSCPAQLSCYLTLGAMIESSVQKRHYIDNGIIIEQKRFYLQQESLTLGSFAAAPLLHSKQV